jgi:hypothetical protein
MNLSVGIVGFPNVGKSTLFNALLKKQVAASANYPFTTIEPNVGVVEVPDERVDALKKLVEETEGLAPSYKTMRATVNFVDIAGLVKGAAQGEGLGNQFLSHIREVDVIAMVLRDFKSSDVIKSNSEEPAGDAEVLKSELLLKDLETLTKRVDSMAREVKIKPATDPIHGAFTAMEKAKGLVESGTWLVDAMTPEELEKIKDLQLLSTKKIIYVINSDEGDLSKGKEDKEGGEGLEGAIRISAKLEEELSGLSEDEQKEYLKELGVEEPGLNILIKKAYETLGLITFFTAGPKEVHAWTTHKGTLAPQGAGVIHTDFERGFIAAEVIDWKELVDVGGWTAAKGKGLIKTIGKTEEIKDGMVVEFRFSV